MGEGALSPSPRVCRESAGIWRERLHRGRSVPACARLCGRTSGVARAGFTLIELIVVVAIIAILASGLLPLAELAAQRSREQDLRVGLREIRNAIDAYKQATDDGRVMKKADQSGYPPSLDVLVSGVPNEKTPDKLKIYFLRRLPRDPFFDDPNVSADKTWGLRSYQSPPDDPHEGEDVFDVYSKSTKKGLNGTPYKQW